MADHYALGVDGGGTKTAAWLACRTDDGEPRLVGRGLAGSSNPRGVGMETALANLAAAVESAWREAKVAQFPVDVAVLAIAGTSHPIAAERVRTWALDHRLARDVRMVHDADPVLAGGTREGRGVALIVGTGASAVGVGSTGAREIIGGWGYWFGDEGSAYWIGREALRAIARAADGRGQPTALTDAILSHLGVRQPRGLLANLEHEGDVRRGIADVTPVVLQVAADGDAAAVGILDAAAGELAALVAAAVRRSELGATFPLALAGGVACGSQILREKLVAAIGAWGLSPAPVELVLHPVGGCLALAWQWLATKTEPVQR